KENFSFKQLFDLKTMEVYYEILNIVGKRMQFYPQAKIELVGCNSDQGLEKDKIGLSRDRAETVKKYLVDEWGIDPTRITVNSQNLPDNPSNVNEPDGIVENRRVEMNANIPQIFEPMNIKDTLRTSNPPHIRFKPVVNSAVGSNRWKIITYQNGKEL
ncbi:MAG: OmpA family protein, partial [Candidatus Kapaibacterium sp.]